MNHDWRDTTPDERMPVFQCRICGKQYFKYNGTVLSKDRRIYKPFDPKKEDCQGELNQLVILIEECEVVERRQTE